MALVDVLAELKRRRVFRALVGYGIAAFAVLQIIEPIMHGLHWPDEVLTYVVVALALGFPVVVSLAWIFDVNAGRVERTAPAGNGLRGPRLALILAGVGVLAATPGAVWYLLLRSRPVSPPSEEKLRAELDKVPPASDIRASPSIAVLPLVNMSSDKEQEYFSDGLSEELLNLLARVPGLRVAARTSAFAFKGRNVKMSEIGRELGVATVLEGSVRKSGEQIRITTQLINAADGFHLWSGTYDRRLTEVFAVQDEIAQAVVDALKLKLLPSQGEKRAVNPEAHDLYLLGWHFLRQNSLDGAVHAIEQLEKALAIDPGYALAWAALSRARFWAADQDPTHNPPARLIPGAQEAAGKAIALAPELPQGWVARGTLRNSVTRDWAGARSDLERALSLSPGNAEALVAYARLAATVGQLPQAIAQAWALNAAYQIAEVLAWQGEIDRAYDWLGHAYDGHDPGLNYLKYDPMLKNLRPDPRYAALLRKMKLPLD